MHEVMSIENTIKNTDGVLSYRLCGAGNGGYMLVVSKNKIKFDDFLNQTPSVCDGVPR